MQNNFTADLFAPEFVRCEFVHCEKVLSPLHITINNNNNPMNLLKNEVAAFGSLLKKAEKDKSLFATHISLLAALFVFWQRNGFKSPFNVNRKELMAFSKIASIATYHKCMRELDGRRYIKYAPSFHPKTGSLVYWLSPFTSTPSI
ncbi:hypothetical protein ACVW0P_004485 [Mucilaginibacter sp. UYNi724]